MFSNLTEKLNSALHVLKGHGKITEINIAETLKEVRRALLDADVSFKIAKEFTNTVKEKALGQNVLTTLQPGQLMVKIVKDELSILLLQDAYTSSPYAKQPVESLVSTLNSMGYDTSFFHGAPNGSMGFLGFSNILEFDHYYGKTRYQLVYILL